LANPWPADASELVDLWPRLSTKQRRQLVMLARSMVD